MIPVWTHKDRGSKFPLPQAANPRFRFNQALNCPKNHSLIHWIILPLNSIEREKTTLFRRRLATTLFPQQCVYWLSKGPHRGDRQIAFKSCTRLE